MPLGEPSLTEVPRYSIGVKAPGLLYWLPNAQEPNSYGVNSQTVAFSAMISSPASRLFIAFSKKEPKKRKKGQILTYSAAMMIGMGKLAFPKAATTEGRLEKVRLGLLES